MTWDRSASHFQQLSGYAIQLLRPFCFFSPRPKKKSLSSIKSQIATARAVEYISQNSSIFSSPVFTADQLQHLGTEPCGETTDCEKSVQKICLIVIIFFEKCKLGIVFKVQFVWQYMYFIHRKKDIYVPRFCLSSGFCDYRKRQKFFS